MRKQPPAVKLYHWLTGVVPSDQPRNFGPAALAQAKTEDFDMDREVELIPGRATGSQLRQEGPEGRPFTAQAAERVEGLVDKVRG